SLLTLLTTQFQARAVGRSAAVGLSAKEHSKAGEPDRALRRPKAMTVRTASMRRERGATDRSDGRPPPDRTVRNGIDNGRGKDQRWSRAAPRQNVRRGGGPSRSQRRFRQRPAIPRAISGMPRARGSPER